MLGRKPRYPPADVAVRDWWVYWNILYEKHIERNFYETYKKAIEGELQYLSSR